VIEAFLNWAQAQGGRLVDIASGAHVVRGTTLGSTLRVYAVGGRHAEPLRIARALARLRRDRRARHYAHVVAIPDTPEWRQAASFADAETRARFDVWLAFVDAEDRSVRTEPPPKTP
jgi:hypothetical protein